MPPGGPGGEEVRGGLPDLGKAADRLLAWEVATLEGAGTFSKYQQDERKDYQELIEKIRKANLEDRLGGRDARTLLMKALRVNERGGRQAGDVTARLKALDAEVDTALTDSVNAATLTPQLNQLQWLVSEALIYGSKTQQISAAKVSSINRKLLAHEEKEVKAKSDGRLTDLERKRLDEGALKIWNLLVKELKGRND